MASECRACLSTISTEFIHLGSDFTEEQTYFDCFNECAQLQTSWDDEFSNVICQTCLNTLHIAFDFIKTAQKSDFILQSRSNSKTSITEKQNSEIFQKTDIENMEIVVLESLNEPTTLKEQVMNDYDLVISENDEFRVDIKQNSKFTCQICNFVFELQAQLEEHLHDEHNEVEINAAGFIALVTCETCSKTFESNEILKLHTLIFHESNMNCALCSEPIGTDFEGINEHISIKHPIEFAKLFENSVETSTNDEDELVEDCPTDDDLTANEDNVNDLKTHSLTMLSQCAICNEELSQRSIEEHMAKHMQANNEKQFLCSHCPRDFKNKKSLRQHEKIHFEATEDEVHICTDCNRQYSTENLLEQHRKNTHKLREYACDICGNAFKLKNQLNNHMKLHLEKNISCPHCDKKYARLFDLNVHLRSHTGEMPYECHLCEKKFAIKVRLTYHLQKHYGIKHNCKECGAQFNSKTKLKAHSFKHTGMPYRCEVCDNHGFPNRDVFKRHLLRVHNATITEEDLLDMFQRNTGKSTRIREVNSLSE